MHEVSVASVRDRANAFGIAGFIFGLLALVICWVPILGLAALPVAALGAVLSLVGLLTAVSFRRSGVGFPIAGLVICGLAVAGGILNVVGVSKVTSGVIQSVAEASEKQLSTNQEVVGSSPSTPPLAESSRDMDDAAVPAVAEEEKWASADSAVRQGPVEVAIIGVVRGRVTVVTQYPDLKVPLAVVLSVRMKITNITETKKLSFTTWRQGEYSFGREGSATLLDDFGNSYSHVALGGRPIGGILSGSIYPGKAITEVVVFELPIDKARHLDLTLPAASFGGDGMLRFRIPVSMITDNKKEEPDFWSVEGK